MSLAAVAAVLLFGPPAPLVARYALTNQTLASVDDRLFGFFLERPSWGNETGVEAGVVPGTHRLQPKVVKLLKGLKIPILRFPGGTDVDYTDWTDMIDMKGRPERPVTTGNQGGKVTNWFGYDEFLNLAERDLKTQVILPVRFRDGLLGLKPLDQEANKAAALVAYANAPVGRRLPNGLGRWAAQRAANGRLRPWRARYFQIGNETWFFVNDLRKRFGEKANQRYVDALRAFVDAMRAVDPSITIIADNPDREIAKMIRAQLGSRVSFLVDHLYAPWEINGFQRDGAPYPTEKLTQEEIWNGWTTVFPADPNTGRGYVAMRGIDEQPSNGYPLAVTEWNWNGWWGPAHYQKAALDSQWAKGVGAAGMLHGLMRNADKIKIACMSNTVGKSWEIAAIRVDPSGKQDPYYMPTGQVLGLYSRYHGSRLMRLDEVAVPTFAQPYKVAWFEPKPKVQATDVVATAGTKAVYLHAINRSFSSPVDLNVDLSAFRGLVGRGQLRMLQGRLNNVPKPGEKWGSAWETARAIRFDPKRLRLTLPARTVSVIVLDRR